ncbi:hypothetical protein EDB87DRAFT_1250478 [Lactarius vividus]|nr:hypothetical protein EDB87DRAFT_1250478 [Lactarius vividus]
MSILVPQLLPPSPDVTQSQVSALAPGIASLFIQGIESGLVFAQFFEWFCARDPCESPVNTTIVIFVTVVGLAQSGICFASAWTTYVQRFGLFLLPDWNDYVHLIPNLLISAPVQALMIRRCHILVGKNMFIVTPLVLLLVASIVVSLWSIISIVKLLAVVPAKDILPSFQGIGINWSYLMSLLLPTFLDLILTGVLLYYLTRMRKRVYTPYARKWISHFANIVWQSALPPTLCTICLSIFYVRYATVRQTLTTYFPFSDKNAVMANSYPGDDREALRSLAVILDQRPTSTTRRATYSTHVDAHCTNRGRAYPHVGRLRWRRLRAVKFLLGKTTGKLKDAWSLLLSSRTLNASSVAIVLSHAIISTPTISRTSEALSLRGGRRR